MDLTITSFDDPLRFRPAPHFGTEIMHCAWFKPEGLLGQRSDECQPLVDRRMNAVGKLPVQA